jgi:CHASE3 domain sensor protein
MKLTTKLYMGFGTSIQLVLLLLIIVLQTLNANNKSLNEGIKDRYEKFRLTSVIQNEIGNVGRGLRDQLLISTNEDRDRDSLEG